MSRYILSIQGELPAVRRTDLPYRVCSDSVFGYEKVAVESEEEKNALMAWYMEDNSRGKVIGVFPADEATSKC